MKNKLPVFSLLLFSIFLFLFVCFNFSDSSALGETIENDRIFFADSGSFAAEVDSARDFLLLYGRLEEQALFEGFLNEKLAGVVRGAEAAKAGTSEQLAARIGDFAEKISAKSRSLADSHGEERVLVVSSLAEDLATLKEIVNLSAQQKLGMLKSTYIVWQDFLNKTVIAVSALFLFFSFLLAVDAIRYRNKVKGLTSAIGVGPNAGLKEAEEKLRQISERGDSEIDELSKKYAREQIVGKRKENLLNAIPEGLMAVSAECVIFLNRTMKDWFGADQSVIGEKPSVVFEKIGIKGNEKKFSFNDETYSLSVFENQNETFYIIRNITESEELSSKLLNSERLASIGEMAARITHEIRNPLNTIKLNSTYLAENIDEIESSGKSQLLQLIVGEVERLEQITNKYMGMVAYHKNESEPAGVSLPDDLLEFISFHLPELQKRNIDLTVGKNEAVSLSISIDSFKEIMLNLLKNAWEELENGGKIAVSISRNGSFAVISVEDSGRGVPESEREAIFKNFYTNKPGGTGIGLSHSRKLATEAGGKLYAAASELGGAAFILELPLVKKA